VRIFSLEFASPYVSLVTGVPKDELINGLPSCGYYSAVARRWLELPTNPTRWILSNAQSLEFTTEFHHELFLRIQWFNERQKKERSLLLQPDTIASGPHANQGPFAAISNLRYDSS
jgi:hypothetical protein